VSVCAYMCASDRKIRDASDNVRNEEDKKIKFCLKKIEFISFSDNSF
jgi:hypothetical protein